MLYVTVCPVKLQYMQVSEQSAQLWNQQPTAASAMQKMPMQMPVKQPFFMSPQDPLKLFEHPLPPVPLQAPPPATMDKKMKFPEVKVQDFYWDPPYRMTDSRSMMGHQMASERLVKRQPGVFCPGQDSSQRGPSYEVSHSPCWAQSNVTGRPLTNSGTDHWSHSNISKTVV